MNNEKMFALQNEKGKFIFVDQDFYSGVTVLDVDKISGAGFIDNMEDAVESMKNLEEMGYKNLKIVEVEISWKLYEV